MFQTKAQEESSSTSSTSSNSNDNSSNFPSISTVTSSRLFAASLSKTKSILESTTSSIKSVSEKAPSIIANTTSTINHTVKKTSAQLSEASKKSTSYKNISNNINITEIKNSINQTTQTINKNINTVVVVDHLQSIEEKANQKATQTMNTLSNILSPKYTVPDRAVASQVLMYRQILHTECKPGLRLSRDYQGTEAQKKVMYMPWWEQGVEHSKRMVISYNNLIVRLWLNGAIMPFVDGGYAQDHVDITVPKDDDDDNNNNNNNNNIAENEENDDNNDDANDEKEIKTTSATPETKFEQDEHPTKIDTLIDSNGLPPIPHPYWVDRLGFQQTDPVTDFRSGGVLSLAMLVHIVEACPNVHARFLPSGDAHMLPFGITCINITDMLAKFCMFSKAVESMDALLSQRPFWRMFADPNSLLVLQELSMEVLCNVVVEMGRERRIPKVKDEVNNKEVGFSGQDETDQVTVFDFAEILTRTEKRVQDDLLGSGPQSVDDLRAIHTRNYTKYMRALERKEQKNKKRYDRVITKRNNSKNSKIQNGSIYAAQEKEFLVGVEEAKKATMIATENAIGSASDMFNKFKTFGFRSNEENSDKDAEKAHDTATEEVDFAVPKSEEDISSEDHDTKSHNYDLFDTSNVPAPPIIEKKNDSNDLFDMSDAPAPPIIEKENEISVDDLFDDIDTTMPSVNFTIDDEDFL